MIIKTFIIIQVFFHLLQESHHKFSLFSNCISKSVKFSFHFLAGGVKNGARKNEKRAQAPQFSSIFPPFFDTMNKSQITEKLNKFYASREKLTKKKKSPISKLGREALIAKVLYYLTFSSMR